MTKNRILGFDFLRGLCAIGVAYYHVLGWLGVSDIKLYSIGLYGIYIFFILSGASIYIAYEDKIRAGYDLRKFIGQRLFRLCPLFALVVLAGPFVHHESLAGYTPDFLKAAVLNMTFAFGLASPGATSLVTGGWSLGIEFIFYLLFPVILSFVAGGIWSNVLLLGVLAALQLLFVSSHITGAGSLDAHWNTYTQFLSFAAYFVAGCVIGRIMTGISVRSDAFRWQIALWLAFLALAAIVLLLNGSYKEAPLVGARLALLPVVCVALVLIAGYMRFPAPTMIVASTLGNMSYGLYLLHPPAFMLLYRRLDASLLAHPVLVGTAIIAAAAVIAGILERYFERPITLFGKRILAASKGEPQIGIPKETMLSRSQCRPSHPL